MKSLVDITRGADSAFSSVATAAEVSAGTATGKTIDPAGLRAGFLADVDWTVRVSRNGEAIRGTSLDGAANALVGVVSGAGIGSGVVGVVTNDGSGHGVSAAVTGNGTGSGLSSSVNGTGSGHGITATVNGNGTGHAVFGQVVGNGHGHGVTGQISGSGNGHGGYFAVGALAASTGTGYAMQAIAFDGPNNNAHGRAIHGQAINAAAWAGYFDGAIFTSVGLTTSDRRLKSDFKPVNIEDAKRLLDLPIQTFVKHQNGQVRDKAEGEQCARLRSEIAAREARIAAARLIKPETTADANRIAAQINDDTVYIAKANAHITKWDAEEWLPMLGDPLPGRLAGVIAQDVQAIAPEYVRQIDDGTLVLNDVSVLYSMVAALKAEVSALRARIPGA